MGIDNLTPEEKQKLEDRFWSRVDRSGGPNAPWIWQGYVLNRGKSSREYGAIKINGKVELAHRIAWELINGPIPEGLCVMHIHDDPKNVNPSHLKLGTHQDNMDDMNKKGRGVYLRGSMHGKSCLNEQMVRDIRKIATEGLSRPEIARICKLPFPAVRDVLTGRTWRHVS